MPLSTVVLRENFTSILDSDVEESVANAAILAAAYHAYAKEAQANGEPALVSPACVDAFTAALTSAYTTLNTTVEEFTQCFIAALTAYWIGATPVTFGAATASGIGGLPVFETEFSALLDAPYAREEFLDAVTAVFHTCTLSVTATEGNNTYNVQ